MAHGSPAGPQEPQPAPQDPDKLPSKQQGATAPGALVPAQPVPAAESPRPSQPPADDSVLETPAASSGTASKQSDSPMQQGPTQEIGKSLSHLAGRTDVRGQGAKQMQLQSLREHVTQLTEVAACLPTIDSNEAECEKVGAVQSRIASRQ